MITPAYSPTATERVLPRLALDFTTGVLDPRVTVTRALNTATRVNSSGLIEIVDANLPRFDYDPATLVPRGLLIEETRTNLPQQTDALGTSPWSLSNASYSAFKLTENTATSAHQTRQQISLVSGTTYTVSAYVGSASERRVVLRLRDSLNTGREAFVVFNPATGLSTATGGTTWTATVLPSVATTDGFRVAMSVTVNVTASVAVDIALADSSNALFYAGDGTSGAFVRRVQVEAGSFATSYIPTTTTSLTRNADVVQMTGTNFSDWYNASEGAFLAKFSFPAIPASQFRYVLSANDGTATNFIAVAGNTTSNVPAGRVITSSVTQASMGGGAISNNQQIAGVLAYKLNDFAYSQGGATTGTDTSGTVPTVNRLEIGALVGSYANCHMQRISYWPQRITNSETLAFSK